MSCKFYGKHWAGSSFGLVDSLGNQCGAVRRSYAPCRMEVLGVAPDETQCALAVAEPGEKTLFDRTGEKARIRLPRSPWVDARIVISSRNGKSYMLQLDKPILTGVAGKFPVHPTLGFVAMPYKVDGDRWRDVLTGAYIEVEFTGEAATDPPLQDGGPSGNASTHS